MLTRRQFASRIAVMAVPAALIPAGGETVRRAAEPSHEDVVVGVVVDMRPGEIDLVDARTNRHRRTVAMPDPTGLPVDARGAALIAGDEVVCDGAHRDGLFRASRVRAVARA